MVKTVIRALLIGLIALQCALAGDEDNRFFAARRASVMKKIEGSIAVLKGASDIYSYQPFRQDNNFYYLTGVESPDALLVIDSVRHQSILFLQPRDKKKEIWNGPRLFPGQEACKETGLDEVLPLSSFKKEMDQRVKGAKSIYAPFSPEETAAASRDRARVYIAAMEKNFLDGRISQEAAFEKNLKEKFKPISIKDLSSILDEMRRVKDNQEIARLREAGRIGALGIKEAMRSARPGMYERQLAATAQFIFTTNGAEGFSFAPIVGAGKNSCYLHYYSNTKKIEDNDIIVMDFGPDYRYYASDITRTFPASGKFSEEQRKDYAIVLEAQKAAIEKVRPGMSFYDVWSAARSVLSHYGVMDNMPHGVSHYVGMSVHDVGKNEQFVPGVVITVEPGIYFPEIGLGVRIEDTVLVTENGYEILTNDVPKEISEIENLMSGTGISATIK